jgi:group I intron endonuclease
MPFRTGEERREYLRKYRLRQKAGNSGIYRITCVKNQKIYIGSAVNLTVREQLHRRALIRGDHDNSMLQRAWRKYGETAFAWDVLELVDPEHLVVREQHFIDLLGATDKLRGFNLAPKAGSMLGFKQTPEAIEKVALAHRGKKQSPELIEKRVAPLRGRKRSRETVEKAAEAQRGVKRQPLSDEHKSKVSAALMGKRPQNLETLWTPEVTAKREETKRRRKAEAARLRAEQRAQATFLRTGIKPAVIENPKSETQGKLFDD